MKKAIFLLLILFIVFLSTNLVISQQNEEDAKFQKFLDSYFDAMWKFYPTAGTIAGYHKYNNKLEDLSSKSIEKRHEGLDKFNQELVTKIDREKLSPEIKIDHHMMVDLLDRELFKHESLLPWEYDPLFYNEIFDNCIRSLLTKDFASLEIRAKNASERLKALPKLIKQAKENLKTPPQIYTETAIKQFPAILNFYKTELPSLIEQVPAAFKTKLQEGLSKVSPALEDYQNFLQNELLARSTGNVRLGEAHRRLVRLTFENDIPLQELIARAKADYKNIRREIFLVCIPFYKIMEPKIDLEHPPANLTEDQLINATITHVFDKIKKDHPTKEEFINQIKNHANQIKSFLLEKDLVELPEENLQIEPMPPQLQGKSWIHLLTPGAYETSGSYTEQINPIPDEWEQDKVESFLQEYNNFFLYFWTVGNVYPGQFVPLYFTRTNPSFLRKMYPNKPLIKGWPLYIEEMLPKNGFGNYDLRLRLNQLKLKLRAAIDFQLEFNIHEGGMTKEQAIAYMTRGGFQTQAEAERKWNYIILNPGEAAFAYVGYQEILDMEKAYKNLKGEAFSHKEFLKKLLSYGALPIRILKKRILE